jgi:hypothetical protein
MSKEPPGFRRIVLSLAQGVPDRGAFRFAAEFAGLLRLDLVGLFIEDLRLAELAEASVLREVRTLESRWLQVKGGDLRRDLELSLDLARREFEAAAGAVGIGRRFEVVRATTAEAITAFGRAGDILMVAAPKAAIDRAGRTFAELAAAAFAARSAVLLVPSSLIRERGPILAITRTPDDPILATAAGIAAAVKERVDVVAAAHRYQPTAAPALAGTGERMIVIARGTVDEASLLTLVSQRRIPVLVNTHTESSAEP